MNPVIDLEKIDWNSMTDTKSVFESILDALKSSDRENAEMRKEIKRLAKEAEAFSKEREALVKMGEKINLLEEENEQKDGEIEQIREENEQKDGEIEQIREENEQKDGEIKSLRAENAALLQGQGATEAVMDRIARLEKAVADSTDKISISRAKNVAPCGINLCESGSKSLRKPDLVHFYPL